MRKLRHLIAVLAVLTGGLVLTACGDGSDGQTSASNQSSAKTINIKFEGKTVTPNGERISVAIGQPVKFVVTADAPGEIHVHSSPERQLEYGTGTTILDLGSFKTAGIIEVESHALEKTIVQLEVK